MAGGGGIRKKARRKHYNYDWHGFMRKRAEKFRLLLEEAPDNKEYQRLHDNYQKERPRKHRKF